MEALRLQCRASAVQSDSWGIAWSVQVRELLHPEGSHAVPEDWWQLNALGSAGPSPAKGAADAAKQPQRKAKPARRRQKAVKVQPSVADGLLAAAAQPQPAAAHTTAGAQAPIAAEALAAAKAPAAAEVPPPDALLSSNVHAAGLEGTGSRPTSAAIRQQTGIKRGRPSSGSKGRKSPGKKSRSSMGGARRGRQQSAKSHGACEAELPVLDDHQLLQVLQRLVAPAGAVELAQAPHEASTVGQQQDTLQQQLHPLVSLQPGHESKASTAELAAAGLQEASEASLAPQCTGWAPEVAAGQQEHVQEHASRLPNSHSTPAAGAGGMEVDTTCAVAELVSLRLTVSDGLEAQQPVSMHLSVGQPQPEALPCAAGSGAAGTELAPAAAAAADAGQMGGAAGQQQPAVAGKLPGRRGLGKDKKKPKHSPLRQKAGVGKRRAKTVTRLVTVADGLAMGEPTMQMCSFLSLQPQIDFSSGIASELSVTTRPCSMSVRSQRPSSLSLVCFRNVQPRMSSVQMPTCWARVWAACRCLQSSRPG